MKNADDISVKMGGSLEEFFANAKARLLQILSDPEPGNPWKLDVPVSFPDESLYPIPGNYWARGNLIEIIQYKRIYKPLGYKHHPNAPGYDYFDSGLPYAQMKSIADPATSNAISRMKKAIDKLIEEATKIENGGPNAEMILDIVTKKSDVAVMQAALDDYLVGNQFADQIEVFVNPISFP